MKKIILGTAQLGLDYGINNHAGQPNLQKTKEILDYAFENSVRDLDTAELYGDAIHRIGAFHRATGRKFRIVNKFKAASYSSPDEMQTSVLQSLEVLDTDTYEVLMYHSFKDFATGHFQQILKSLQKRGAVRKTGVSIYSNEELLRAIESDIDIIQVPFNLLDNHSQRGELLLRAKSVGKEIHVRSVFLQGLFFVSKPSCKLSPLKRELNIIEELADEYCFSIDQMALEYVYSKDYIDAILIGVDTLDQLKKNISIFKKMNRNFLFAKIDFLRTDRTDLLSPVNW